MGKLFYSIALNTQRLVSIAMKDIPIKRAMISTSISTLFVYGMLLVTVTKLLVSEILSLKISIDSFLLPYMASFMNKQWHLSHGGEERGKA